MRLLVIFFWLALTMAIISLIAEDANQLSENTTVIYKSDRLACDGRGE